jgi:hypothetical protein
MKSEEHTPITGAVGIRRMLVIAMILDISYWTAWFIEPRLISDDTSEAFLHYENAFPLGHLLVLIAVAGSYLMLGNERLAGMTLIWLPAAAGAKGYITGVDVLYNLQHDGYTTSHRYYIALRLAFNVLTLGFTIIALRWTWGHRQELITTASRPDAQVGASKPKTATAGGGDVHGTTAFAPSEIRHLS